MRKIILSIAMLATVAFIGCANDDDEPTCKTCNDIAFFEGLSLEFCDNGDNTITITGSLAGIETASEIVDIPEGETFEDYDCANLEDFGFDLTAFTK